VITTGNFEPMAAFTETVGADAKIPALKAGIFAYY